MTKQADPKVSKYFLTAAIEILTRPASNDEERDATVRFFELWGPAQFLTTDDAYLLREAITANDQYVGWHIPLLASVDAELRGRIN